MTLRHRNTAKRVKQVNNAMHLLFIGERTGRDHTMKKCVCVDMGMCGCQTPLLSNIHEESLPRLLGFVHGSTFGEKKKKDGGTVTYGHSLWAQCANRLLFLNSWIPSRRGDATSHCCIYRTRQRKRVRTEGGWEEVTS